jgi:hypothetical protein
MLRLSLLFLAPNMKFKKIEQEGKIKEYSTESLKIHVDMSINKV